MKGSRTGRMLALSLAVAFWAGAAMAQGPEPMPGDEPPAGPHEMMMGHGMPGKGKMGMPPMMCMMKGMMKGMMERTVVATSDGGVVVVVGNKIIKYDKDLNLVKEAEIKIDLSAMHKDMMEMMKNCPMMKDRMKGPGAEEKDAGKDKEAVVPPPPPQEVAPAAVPPAPAEEKK